MKIKSNGPINGPIKLTERQELILQMFAVDKSLSIGKLCEKTGLSMVRLGFASCGRASLTLPRAILRKASEKAGAGMCRLDFFDCPAFTGMEFPTACQSKKPAVYRQRAFSYFRDSVGIRQNHVLFGGIGYFTGRNNVV